MSKPFVIGITGTIGSGKSAVGSILTEMGIPVIDSDKVVHDLFSTNKILKERLVAEFGPAIVGESGVGIDRKALGKIVFSDPKAKEQLEDIVHPLTIEACLKELSKYSGQKIVAILVPLLFEAAPHLGYDETWAVITDEKILLDRLTDRDKISTEQAIQRLNAQFSQEKKAKSSTHVIDNSGSLEQTTAQVHDLVSKCRTSIMS